MCQKRIENKIIPSSFKKTAVCICAFAVALASPYGDASTIMVDDFIDGEFTLTYDRSGGIPVRQGGSMLGGVRNVVASTDDRITTVTASVLSGTSVISFDTGNGPAQGMGLGEGFMRLFWTAPNLNLLGFDSFYINIPRLEGEGQILVYLNGGFIAGQPNSYSINSPGEILIPIGDANLVNGGLSDVSSIHLVVTGETSDFSLDIDSFQIVPEPSISLLLTGAILFGLSRRKRGCLE